MEKTANIFEGKDGQWYLRLVAPNGEPLLTSEGHKNLLDVRKLWQEYFPDWTLDLTKGGES